MIELTDAAISKTIEKTSEAGILGIRLGVKSGGCAGFEYIFDYCDKKRYDDDVIDYGKFKVFIDEISAKYLNGVTLDYVKEGINEQFKIVNPNESISCGCGVSVGF